MSIEIVAALMDILVLLGSTAVTRAMIRASQKPPPKLPPPEPAEVRILKAALARHEAELWGGGIAVHLPSERIAKKRIYFRPDGRLGFRIEIGDAEWTTSDAELVSQLKDIYEHHRAIAYATELNMTAEDL